MNYRTALADRLGSVSADDFLLDQKTTFNLISEAVAELRKCGPNDAQDAERYRWLRNGTLIPYLSPHVIAPVAGSDDRSVVRSPEELDAAMDLAMKRHRATNESNS